MRRPFVFGRGRRARSCFATPLAVPETADTRSRSRRFDRCANPCSLYPPQAALPGVARHAPRASGSPRLRKTQKASASCGDLLCLAGAEGLEPSARGFGAAVEKMKHPANPPLLQPFGCTQRRVDALLMLLSVPRIPPYAFGSFIPSTSGAMLISY